MGRPRSGDVGAGPGRAKLVLAIAVVVPDGLGVAEDEVSEVAAWCQLIEISQVADEGTLELLAVCAAVAGLELALVSLDEDAVGVGQGVDGGVGNGRSSGEERPVSGGLVELAEAAEDHTLVVRPCGQAIVLAVGVESVVDEVVGVDHAAVLKELPLSIGNVEVRGVGRHTVGEGGGDRKVQLVGNGVDVGAVLAPVDAAAGGSQAGLHVIEDFNGRVEVVLVASGVVGVDQGESPPSFIIIKVIDEVAEASFGETGR